MGNIEICQVISTTLIPEFDSHLAKVFIPPFYVPVNPVNGSSGIFGTRDTIVVTMSFDRETDNLVNLDGIRLYEIDHSQGNGGEIFEYNDNTHRNAAKHYLYYWTGGMSAWNVSSFNFRIFSSQPALDSSLSSNSTNSIGISALSLTVS